MVALVGVGRATAAVKTKAVPNTWLEYFLAFQFDNKVQFEVNNGYVV